MVQQEDAPAAESSAAVRSMRKRPAEEDRTACSEAGAKVIRIRVASGMANTLSGGSPFLAVS